MAQMRRVATKDDLPTAGSTLLYLVLDTSTIHYWSEGAWYVLLSRKHN